MNAAWIGDRRAYDLVFFFGSGLFAVAIGGAVMAAPVLLIPAWWLFVALVDGPHLTATLSRSYLDRAEWKKRPRVLWRGLAVLAIPAAALAISNGANSPALFEALLLFAALWAFHHVLRQHYGIMAVYQRQTRAAALWRRIDWWYLHASQWMVFALFALGHPANRTYAELPAEPGGAALTGLFAVASLLALGTLVYAVSLLARWRLGQPLRPGLFALFPVGLMTMFAYFIVGGAEPLVAAPQNSEQYFLAVGLVIGLVHGIQYLGIALATGPRRYGDREDLAKTSEQTPSKSNNNVSLAARIGRSRFRGYLAFVALASLLVLVNGARGIIDEAALFALDSDVARWSLAIYWGLFFNHYYIDQHIWRPSREPSLRRELNLVPRPTSDNP